MQTMSIEDNFVAINYINCRDDYKERFEELFKSRKKAIDLMPGFVRMQVLKPNQDDNTYLVVSHWEDEDSFKAWTKSEAFLEGHRRGFADVQAAKDRGEEAPMKSDFKTYEVLT